MTDHELALPRLETINLRAGTIAARLPTMSSSGPSATAQA